MKDEHGGSNLAAFLAAILICQTIVFAVLFQIWTWPASFCPATATESHATCIREWLVVIAAWLTFLGGGIAAVFVYKTIRPMRQQLSEARTQTSFMVGDSDPTVELLPTEGNFESIEFNVTNWNRRSFIIQEMRWVVNDEKHPIYHIADWDLKEGLAAVSDGSVQPSIRVPGWKDRSVAPPQRHLRATWMGNQVVDEIPEDVRNSVGMLVVTGQLAGKPNVMVSINAADEIRNLYEC